MMLEYNMLEKMTFAFLTDYLAVVFVDLETHHYQYYSHLSHLEQSLRQGDFFESFTKDACLYTVEEDREKSGAMLCWNTTCWRK